MFAKHTRISAGLCLALTLGTIVNVFALQSPRSRPLAAAAVTLPDAVELLNSNTKPPGMAGAPAPAEPAGQIMGSADADLSVRTALDPGGPSAQSPTPPTAQIIASIQRQLAEHGYDAGKVNGTAGILTRAAILAFEFDNHFPLTAEPSEELMRQIVLGMSAAPGTPLPPPTDKARRLIAGAQRLLLRLGYDPGPIDGQLTDPTRKAIRRFEGDMGLVPKGRVSGAVLSELARRAHARIEVSDEALSN